MQIGKNKVKLDNCYAVDFETTTQKYYNKNNKVKVWGWDINNIKTNESVLLGTQLNQFFDFFQKQQQNTYAYFHNLKFDGTFVLYWLFENGFTYSENKKLKPYEFNTLISDMGQWYQIKVCWKQKGKNSISTTFYDSYKKLPFSIERIAKAFNLPLQKLEIDYDKIRTDILSEEDIEYIKADTKILSMALKILFEQGQTKMTIGSDAMSDFKERFGTKEEFGFYFPTLQPHYDKEIRKSYKGGFVWANPKYKEKSLQNVISYDVNSLYPYVMRRKKLPYGTPKMYKGEYKTNKRYPLYIHNINVNFKLKKDHIPTIQLKGLWLFKSNEYLENSNNEMVNLWLTKIDYELFLDHYEIIEIDHVGGYMFKGRKGFFNNYIDFWSNIKMNSTGALRELAKLMLNNLYGKFGTNPKKRSVIPYFEDGVVYYNQYTTKIDDAPYTPMASFITAYAREMTIRTAQKYYDRFIYADTDSIHLIGVEQPQGLYIHPTKLGAWKYEGLATRAKFLRSKAYIKVIDGKLNVTCAGMPKGVHTKVTFDNFKIGMSFVGVKLQSKKVKGGTLLSTTDYTLRK